MAPIDLGIASNVAVAVVALAGPLIGYGMSRQKIRDLEGRMTAVETAIDNLRDVHSEVKLLTQTVNSNHTLLIEKQEGSQRLSAERFEGLRGEVRSFLAGEAAAGQRRTRARVQNQG